MKKLIDPAQRIRALKVALLIFLAICLMTFAGGWFYENVWPKKPLFNDTIEKDPLPEPSPEVSR